MRIAEEPRRQLAGDDDHRWSAGGVLRRGEAPPGGQRSAEEGEEGVGDRRAGEDGRPLVAGQGRLPAAEGGHVFERGGLAPVVPIVREGEPLALQTALPGGVLPDRDQPVGVGVGERHQQDGVNEAEDASGGADAQREGERDTAAAPGRLRSMRVAKRKSERVGSCPARQSKQRAKPVGRQPGGRRKVESGAAPPLRPICCPLLASAVPPADSHLPPCGCSSVVQRAG